MRNLIALMLLSGCCVSVNAQQAIVVGPSKSDPGDLIILDASTSVGSGHTWTLANSTKTWLSFEDGRKLVFSSGAAGEYVFILGVASEGKVSLARHVVTIGKPAPKPVDPVKPDEPVKPVDPVIPPAPVLSAIATAARDAALKCDRKPGEAGLLADHFERVASQAGALSWDMRTIAGELAKSFLQGDADATKRWTPYNQWIKTVGPTWTTPAKAAEDFFEIAKGLRSITPQQVSGDAPDAANESLGERAGELRQRLETLDKQVGKVPPL